MCITIVLPAVLFLLLAVLLLRPSPTVSISVSPPPPLQTRRVSFSLVTSDTSYSLAQRRWSSPFYKRKYSALDPPRAPQSHAPHSYPITPVDQFGRIPPFDKPLRRLSLTTPLRLSFTRKRRFSSVSTLVDLDQVDTSSTSATQSPLWRAGFVNPFGKHPRSGTLSPPGSFKSTYTSSSNPSVMSSPPPARRLVNKVKSIFKSIPSESKSSTIHSKPIIPIINVRLRRKPVARTQPYGPPWNAPLPVADFTLSQHSLRKSPRTVSPLPQTSRRCSFHQTSRPEITSIPPVQLSPRTFINELDEKLSLLQERIGDSIPSPHE